MAITLDGSNGITTDIASNESATFNRDTTDGDIIILQKDNATVGSIGALSSRLYIGTSGTGLFFNNDSSAITPYDLTSQSQTDADVDLGVGSVRFKDLYLSGGVYLGGTGAANHLDDYEEGAWTPVVRDGAADGTALTFTVGNASYTKIGNQVFISCYMTRTDSNSRTGRLYLTGLPFTSKSGIAHTTAGIWVDNSSSDLRAFVYIGGGQNHFIFPQAGSSDSFIDNDDLSNNRPFYMSAVYPAA